MLHYNNQLLVILYYNIAMNLHFIFTKHRGTIKVERLIKRLANWQDARIKFGCLKHYEFLI